MKSIPNTFAVYWRKPSWGRKVAFQADIGREGPHDTPQAAARRFKALFPGDIVASVRDGSGRFQAFKEHGV